MIESEDFREKFGGFYEGIRTNSKASLAYFFIFVIRRLSFLYIAFNLYNVATVQFQVLYLVNLIQTIYIGYVKPKTYWLMNYIEIFNEFIFQAVTIHIVIFSDYVPK